MSQREKKLAIVVGALAGLAVCIRVVYPAMIKPVVDIGDEIAALEEELYDYQQEADRLEQARLDYKRLVERTASTDPREVRNELRAKLQALADDAKLDQPRITPRNARRERVGLHYLPVAITAEGTLKETVQFLKSCYELPYVARFEDLKFSPVGGSSSRGSKSAPDRVKLVAAMEVVVLPPDSRVPIDLETLQQPEKVVKYAGESYAMIWDRLPFNKYVKPVQPRPTTDRERVKKSEPKPPPPPPPADTSDKDAAYKKVVVAMSYGVDELLVVNERAKTQEYVATGQELDGGELVLVHPYGGVVRKRHGDFFYEVGRMLSEAIPVAVADDYPEIQAATRRLRSESKPGSRPKDPATSGGRQDDQVAGEEEVARADDLAGDEGLIESPKERPDSGARAPRGPASRKDRAAGKPRTPELKVRLPKAKDDGQSGRRRPQGKQEVGPFRPGLAGRNAPSQEPPNAAARPARGQPAASTQEAQEQDENEDED